MPYTTDLLTPLERDALQAAHHSPTRCLVRTSGGYIGHQARVSTSGIKRIRVFTGRLVNRLEREGLVDFDKRPWPDRAELTAEGLALAEQLAAEEAQRPAKAVRA